MHHLFFRLRLRQGFAHGVQDGRCEAGRVRRGLHQHLRHGRVRYRNQPVARQRTGLPPLQSPL